jgi:type IV pilus assembly protein PilY1
MTTFTIGLGLKGTLTYTRDYLTQTSGDEIDMVWTRSQKP